jgi:hypothetical protein
MLKDCLSGLCLAVFIYMLILSACFFDGSACVVGL